MTRLSSRFTTKPGVSFTRTVDFFKVRPTAKAVASVASSVLADGMISSRGMTATGLKKWNPTTRSGCAILLDISARESEEVFEAMTQVSETMASSSAKTCCLTAMFSKTASMTNPASAKPSFEVLPVMRAPRRLALSVLMRPLETCSSSSERTKARPLSMRP